MFYRAIGLMSGSSIDGLDIVFASFEEISGKWTFKIEAAECIAYPASLAEELRYATNLHAEAYLRLHANFGHYLGKQVNAFIEKHQLQHQVQLIGSHGHTTFHQPQHLTTAQLGDGAAIAAETGLNVVCDLRALDVALGGQGAPIVPMGEKLLFENYPLLLNIGGIANISASVAGEYIAFDIAPANRVLNMLAAEKGLPFDDGGRLAAAGFVRDEVLAKLNALAYYSQPYPKSLSNDFGTEVIFPLLKSANLSTADALRTMVEHIVIQTTRSAGKLSNKLQYEETKKMLVTGGGAFNNFLIERITNSVKPMNVELVVPDAEIVKYKEALIMALLAVLRWREENTVVSSVTGASRNSIGGAVWMGQQA